MIRQRRRSSRRRRRRRGAARWSCGGVLLTPSSPLSGRLKPAAALQGKGFFVCLAFGGTCHILTHGWSESTSEFTMVQEHCRVESEVFRWFSQGCLKLWQSNCEPAGERWQSSVAIVPHSWHLNSTFSQGFPNHPVFKLHSLLPGFSSVNEWRLKRSRKERNNRDFLLNRNLKTKSDSNNLHIYKEIKNGQISLWDPKSHSRSSLMPTAVWYQRTIITGFLSQLILIWLLQNKLTCSIYTYNSTIIVGWERNCLRLIRSRLVQLARAGLTDMGNALTSLPEVKWFKTILKCWFLK